MEHREPPPAGAEGSRTRTVAPAHSGRPAGPVLGLPRPEPVAKGGRRPRLWLAILVGGLLGCYVAYLTARAARTWLGDQPAYQLPFRSIVLDPPPPSWYRGGSEAFLEDLRRRAGVPETISLLRLKPEELRRDFEQSPWTKKVEKITYRPLGVAVRLDYLRPVALVETASKKTYLVDRSAILLPLEDVDLNQLRPGRDLITIKSDGLEDPQDPRVGLPWKPRAGLADLAPGNDRIPAAAKLAEFLIEKKRSIDRASNPALDITYINPIDYRGLFLWNAESHYILWGQAPGEEGSEGLDAEGKWEKLLDWNRSTPRRALPEGDFWKITPEGVIHREYDSQAASAGRPRRDRATIPAKASGQSRSSMSH